MAWVTLGQLSKCQLWNGYCVLPFWPNTLWSLLGQNELMDFVNVVAIGYTETTVVDPLVHLSSSLSADVIMLSLLSQSVCIDTMTPPCKVVSLSIGTGQMNRWICIHHCTRLSPGLSLQVLMTSVHSLVQCRVLTPDQRLIDLCTVWPLVISGINEWKWRLQQSPISTPPCSVVASV